MLFNYLTLFSVLIFTWYAILRVFGGFNPFRPAFLFAFVYFLSFGISGWAHLYYPEIIPIWLLNDDYVSESLLFVLFFMISTIIGFLVSVHLFRSPLNSSFFGKYKRSRFDLLRVKYLSFWLILFAILFFILQLWGKGIGTLMESNIPRGFGQWDPWDMKRYVALGALIMNYIIIFIAGMTWQKNKRKILLLVPALYVILLTSNLSRAFLLPFVLFILAAYVVDSKNADVKKIYFISFVCICGAVLMMGIRSMIVNSFGLVPLLNLVSKTNKIIEIDSLLSIIKNSINAFSALGPLSQSIALTESPNAVIGFSMWVKSILPIPTFLGWFNRSGTLAHEMGIAGGSAGIPFPIFGEIYFLMGKWSILIGGFWGIYLGVLDRKVFHKGHFRANWLWGLIYSATFYSIIRSLHSATRDSTRLIVYVVLLYVFLLIIRGINFGHNNKRRS